MLSFMCCYSKCIASDITSHDMMAIKYFKHLNLGCRVAIFLLPLKNNTKTRYTLYYFKMMLYQYIFWNEL